MEEKEPPKPPGYYDREVEQSRYEKRVRYATLAKEIHKPKVDQNKRLEVLSR